MTPKRRPAALRRSWPVTVLVLVVTAYLAIGALAADRLTIAARHEAIERTPSDAGGTYEDVVVRSADDRVDLVGWVLPVEGADVGVVLVHGIDASRAFAFGGGFVDLAVVLQRAGYQVAMLDLRGHGGSGDGRYTFGLAERYDVIAAIDHLVRERGVRPGSVGLLGTSWWRSSRGR